MQVTRIVLIYNADWSLRGALQYAVETLKGQKECALCDITHRGLTEKSEWKSCALSIPVPIEAIYRNQLDAASKEAAAGQFPCVLADTPAGMIKVLDRAALVACESSPEAMRDALDAALREKSLTL